MKEFERVILKKNAGRIGGQIRRLFWNGDCLIEDVHFVNEKNKTDYKRWVLKGFEYLNTLKEVYGMFEIDPDRVEVIGSLLKTTWIDDEDGVVIEILEKDTISYGCITRLAA